MEATRLDFAQRIKEDDQAMVAYWGEKWGATLTKVEKGKAFDIHFTKEAMEASHLKYTAIVIDDKKEEDKAAAGAAATEA